MSLFVRARRGTLERLFARLSVALSVVSWRRRETVGHTTRLVAPLTGQWQTRAGAGPVDSRTDGQPAGASWPPSRARSRPSRCRRAAGARPRRCDTPSGADWWRTGVARQLRSRTPRARPSSVECWINSPRVSASQYFCYRARPPAAGAGSGSARARALPARRR